MILSYLILGHLLADFVLQPEKLVLFKRKSKKGTLLHSFIHFVVYNLLLLPFIIQGYHYLIFITFVLCVFHFIIDEFKINYDLKTDKKVVPFLVDQTLHLTLIFLASLFVNDNEITLPSGFFYDSYQNLKIILFVSFLVFFAVVIDVYRYQKLREIDKNAKLKLRPKKILDRILLFTIIYFSFLLIVLLLSDA